ncbi:virA/G regulated protein (plasmid) [Agrobacterium leguminum]|uniref:VirA/G regulated protein n=1 Tax=Agrobacterium deltaense NCPPB 1641 TaxID=1183425 RepID=A0A1S7U9W0_9HYPH|nr:MULTISPECIES: hypothetical protein [Agrobacterium]WFS69640.1 virA/G regulated protein [Agrobacterium leguminum]CVI63657.1 VirA/G regulated protein [Agrobacterium deltaense NCPPB 1641]
MVSTTKKKIKISTSADMRRSTKRMFEHGRQAWLTERAATNLRTRSETPQKKRNQAADFQMLDKLGVGFRGEIRYKFLGNRRLRTDHSNTLTSEQGFFKNTQKIVQRDAETGAIHLSLHKTQTWMRVSHYRYAKDGSLRSKQVRYRGGHFEERWERDENGGLIRTRYIKRNPLGARLLGGVSEELGDPYRAGPENRLYRQLTRQRGSRREIFERDDQGNLQLISRKTIGSSKSVTRAADRRSSQTTIRKFGGAFSKSYKSLLDKDGYEIGRDVLNHRRLFNKRSALYDDATGRLTSQKHTFGTLYKSETKYLTDDVKSVTKKIMGVSVSRKLTLQGERERHAQEVRAKEAEQHENLWQHQPFTPRSRPPLSAYLPVDERAKDKETSLPRTEATARRATGDSRAQTTAAASPSLGSGDQGHSPSLERPSPASSHRSSGFPTEDGRETTGEKPRGESQHFVASKQPLLEPLTPAEETMVGRMDAASSDAEGGQRTPVDQPVQVMRTSSSARMHTADWNQGKLLRRLDSTPLPDPLRHTAEGRGSTGNEAGGTLGGASDPTVTPPIRTTLPHPQRGLMGGFTSDTATGSIVDPQALFGRPGLAQKSSARQNSTSNNLPESDRNALLRELHAIPLPAPAPAPKANADRLILLEGSRSRDRSRSGNLSL